MRKTVVLCAALLLALTMMSDAAFSVAASGKTVTASGINDMKNQLKEAEKEKEKLKNSVSDLKKIKADLEKKKGNLTSYVNSLDQNVAQMEANVESLISQIAQKETDINETQGELEAATVKSEQQYESMRTRIRFMYEYGTASSIWDLLTSSDSFSDFLNRADYMNSIYVYDQKMWEEYRLNCEYITLCKAQLELERDILDEQKICVEQEQQRIEQLIAEKSQEIIAYQTDINTKAAAIKEYEADIAAQDAVIQQLEKAVKKAERNLKYDGGSFTFPMESYTRMSSDYGWRLHPTLGVKKFHNGVDFAAPKGTPIYAAYDGEVVGAGYNSSMGNYVMIDHGDELYTIYMHASKLYVSYGEYVVAGEKIAAVGTTGRSTGNHLHFGVRLNGEYVSPWDFLP